MASEVLRWADRKYRAARTAPQPYYPARSRAVRTQALSSAAGLINGGGRDSTRMMTNEVGKLLTASEVAEMLHLHVNTVKRLG